MQQPSASDAGLVPQVNRGAYTENAFVEDSQSFFIMCQQVGGPRLLPSKPRGSQGEADGRFDLAEAANSHSSIAYLAAPSNGPDGKIDEDSGGKDGQVGSRRLARRAGVKSVTIIAVFIGRTCAPLRISWRPLESHVLQYVVPVYTCR